MVSFIGSSKPLGSIAWNLNNLQNLASDLGLITTPFFKGESVWARNTALASHLFDNPNDWEPLPDLLSPHWSLIDNLDPIAASTYWYHQYQHLTHAIELGALQIGPGFSITLNAERFIAVMAAPPATRSQLGASVERPSLLRPSCRLSIAD